MNMELKTTPLIDEHKKLKAKCAPFGGWLMPIQYSGIIDEHNWTRSSATVFDICHMGEFIIEADPVKSRLDEIITFDLGTMVIKSCRYGFMLDENAGIIDDVIIYRIDDKKWMLVVNAATTDTDEVHIRKHLTPDTTLENVSSTLAKLDLQGPLSAEVLADIAGSAVKELGYYRFDNFRLFDENVIISRTGYTGELGFELYISNENAVELWNTILKDSRVKPAGLGARDTLRLEVCYPLYGQDIHSKVSPLEAGLKSFIDLDKDFIGKNALLEKQKQVAGKKLCCFKTQTRRAPRHDYKIFVDDQHVGAVTSGSFSPSLSCGIGMGYIEEAYTRAGTKILLKHANVEIEAVIEKRPFYKKGTAKKNN